MLRVIRVLCVASFALLTGCPFHAPTPVARVHHGPAFGRVVDPIAALPVRCTSEGTEGCVREHLAAVASLTRMQLEFAGYGLVDSELLNAETRRRAISTEGPASDGAPKEDLKLAGATFMDLKEDDRRALLSSIGVHGVLRVSVHFAMPHGLAQQRTVSVEVALHSLLDDTLAWRSKCSVEGGDYNSPSRAVDLATRCALESGSLW